MKANGRQKKATITITITGPQGGGKSTLLPLLAEFLEDMGAPKVRSDEDIEMRTELDRQRAISVAARTRFVLRTSNEAWR